MIRRRDLFLVVTASGVAAAALGASAATTRQVAARRDKRRPQYQANSPEVQSFYRVNAYPAKGPAAK
jgi:hypothetical protein